MMTACGVRADAALVRGRLADENGGIIVAGEACVSWVLDGGALHLYDFAITAVQAGDVLEQAASVVSGQADLIALVDAANTLANGRFAGVIATSLWVDDPLVVRLRDCGFDVDWEEADVRDGKPARLAGLVREVS